MSRKEEVKEALKSTKAEPPTANDFLSTGSTLLNLAFSGHPLRGWRKGTYNRVVGDPHSGKTFITQTTFAEACRNKNFDNYQLLFKDVEGGALMDVRKFFGNKAAERVIATHPNTIEELYYELDDDLKRGPFICVVDSESSLSSKSEADKHSKNKKEYESGKEETGSMTDSKAKIHSAKLRVVNAKVRDSGSILIYISQTRDNIGFGAQFNPKTVSGGHALNFYAALVVWTSVVGQIKKNVNGKDRQLGIYVKAQTKKNRLTGRSRSVEIPILHSAGIDDLGGSIRYLIEEGKWTGSGKTVKAPEFEFSGNHEALIKKIESENLEKQLRMVVLETWEEIESKCNVERKKRYE